MADESIVEIENEKATTKAVVSSDNINDIKNLWVVQYNGTSDSAELVGNPTYISKDMTYSSSVVTANISLIPTNTAATVFFIANTYDSGLAFPKTLEQMRQLAKLVSCEDDLFGYDGENSRLLYSAWAQPASITSGTTVSATLSRNVAKINVSVVNDSYAASPKITVTGVRVCSVPASSYYFPSYGDPSLFPSTEKLVMTDLDAKAWPSGKAQGSASVSNDFVCYLPVNKRGSVSNTVPSLKPVKSPNYATKLVVECTYPDAESGDAIPVEYVLYPGANLLNDFNLEPNTTYNYTVRIKSKGDPSLEMGIVDKGVVDFSSADIKRANCYILNPPLEDGYWRTFCIPVDIVNLFWGYNSSKYENIPEFTLAPGTPWEASVIWSEFSINTSTNFRFVGGGLKYSGTGVNPIKVQIPKGVSGNVLIGIKRKDTAGPYLWSWHLWITDYNPDERHTILPGKYEYPVSGGYVNRLEGGIWNSGGALADAFLMDRCLGESGNVPHTKAEVGMLFYEWGRKDPFSPKLGYTKKVNTNPELADTDEDPIKALKYTFSNPTVFIYGTDTPRNFYWTFGNKYAPEANHTYLWNDPYALVGSNMKSIFDPCPPGWRIPERGTFSMLNTDNFPYVNLGRSFANCVYFPQGGSLNYSSGNWTSAAKSELWESTPMPQKQETPTGMGGHCFSFTSEYITNLSGGRTYGMRIRCVSIPDEENKFF